MKPTTTCKIVALAALAALAVPLASSARPPSGHSRERPHDSRCEPPRRPSPPAPRHRPRPHGPSVTVWSPPRPVYYWGYYPPPPVAYYPPPPPPPPPVVYYPAPPPPPVVCYPYRPGLSFTFSF